MGLTWSERMIAQMRKSKQPASPVSVKETVTKVEPAKVEDPKPEVKVEEPKPVVENTEPAPVEEKTESIFGEVRTGKKHKARSEV